MKKLISFLLLSMAVVGFAACEGDTPTGKDYPTGTGITFMVDVDAVNPGSMATLPLNELAIEEVWAVAFASDGAYKGAVRAQFNKTAWEVGFEGEGKMYILANVFGRGAKVDEKVNGKNESDFLALVTEQSLVKETPAEGQTAQEVVLPMMSEPISFNGPTTIEKTIMLHRLVARIDVINALQGAVLTKIEVNNLVSKGLLGEGMSSDADIYTTATYEGLSLVGNEERPAALTGLYTFENTGSSQRSTVKIYYDYNGEKKEKTLTFPKLERHTLNSIQLIAEGTSINWGADTWEQGEAVREAINTSGTRQHALNAALAISRFVERDVYDFVDNDGDERDETIIFCNPGQLPKGLTDQDMGGNPRWSAAWETEIFVDGDGNRYRMPSGNELKLIAPEGDAGVSIAVNWNAGREDLDITDELSDFRGAPQSGGSGTSDFRCVRTGSGDGYHTNTLYAIRFKNTPQEAAYRYRFETIDGRETITLRVMARDPRIGWSLAQVADESFWQGARPYLTLNFPLSDGNVGEAKYWAYDNPPGQTSTNPDIVVHYYLMLRGDGMFVAWRQQIEPQRARVVKAEE